MKPSVLSINLSFFLLVMPLFTRASVLTGINNEGSRTIASLHLPNGGGEDPNVMKVKQIYDFVGEGNIPALLEMLDPKVVWMDPGEGIGDLYIGKRMGRDQVAAFFGSLMKYLDLTELSPTKFLSDNHGLVVVLGHVAGKTREGSKEFSTDWAMQWKFGENGLIVFHQLYLDSHGIAKALNY
jgi:ketosteroid isomerase-like protein